MMYPVPVIALIGQNNVGKSTLFNKLTCTNDSLVADYPGLTRDRQYGCLQYKWYESIVIDTGGIDGFFGTKSKIQSCVHSQTILAIKESDIVLCIVDGRFLGSSVDYDIIDFVRKSEKVMFIVANKIDNMLCYSRENIWDSFGLITNCDVIPISAIHGYGIHNLLQKIFNSTVLLNQGISTEYSSSNTPVLKTDLNTSVSPCLLNDNLKAHYLKLAIIGKPNSGKSTFVNKVLKKDRMIVCSVPGTTRDSISTPVLYNNQKYLLIDTAGIQKKNKIVNQVAEQISIFKSLKIIKESHVILFMIDSSVGITDQDLSVLEFIQDHGRALVIAMNKWDIVSSREREAMIRSIRQQIRFIDFVKIHFVSALYGKGIEDIFCSIRESYRCINHQAFNTALLTRVMHDAIMKYPPPLLCGGKIIKLKYVHIGGYNPLTLIIHGSRVSKLTYNYQRYLKNFFYRTLKITGVFLHIQLRDTINPFIEH